MVEGGSKDKTAEDQNQSRFVDSSILTQSITTETMLNANESIVINNNNITSGEDLGSLWLSESGLLSDLEFS